MEYSAGLTSKLFWLQESRKTASYILDGYSKADIRKIAWEENIYQVKAEYRAYEVLNGTYRRVFALPEVVLKAFTTCDVETAKILNLIAIFLYVYFDFPNKTFQLLLLTLLLFLLVSLYLQFLAFCFLYFLSFHL